MHRPGRRRVPTLSPTPRPPLVKTPAHPLLFGVLVNGLEGGYQSLMLRGLHAAAQRLGMNLMCFPGHAMGAAFGLDREFNIVCQLARAAGLRGVVALADTFKWPWRPWRA